MGMTTDGLSHWQAESEGIECRSLCCASRRSRCWAWRT